MQRAQSKKTAWIIGIIGVVVAVVAACVAVFVFYLPQRGAEPQASAETVAAAEASPSPSESTKVTPSTTDPMEVIRNYEDFMMKYADFAEMLNSQDGMPASKAEEYTDWLASFDDMMAQFDAVSNSKLTPEQEKYFDEVIDKVDGAVRRHLPRYAKPSCLRVAVVPVIVRRGERDEVAVEVGDRA